MMTFPVQVHHIATNRSRCALLYGLVAVAVAVTAYGTPARITVTSTKPVCSGRLSDGVLIHTNRNYTFTNVPKALHGLDYVLHEHRNPGALSIHVEVGGTLYVCLWEGASLEKLSLAAADWQKAFTLSVGNVNTDPWHVYSGTVAKGQDLALPPLDRWGTVVFAGGITGPEQVVDVLPASPHSLRSEFNLLAKHIQRHQKRTPELKAKLHHEAFRPDALIHDSDRTPVDLVLRRTRALLSYLASADVPPDLAGEGHDLQALTDANKPDLDDNAQRTLFARCCELRRRVAFKNPLLDFDRILFLKHDKQGRGPRHMVDQYAGFNARRAGGVCVLENAFGDAPTVRDLLANTTVANGRLKGEQLSDNGGFISLDLDYDASRILFAWTEAEFQVPSDASYENQNWRKQDVKRLSFAAHYHYRPSSTYHVFMVNADGTNLRQLTDGMYNDFDPCFLPNGRIAFISERAGGNLRCGRRPLPNATLHAMMDDGSDIIQLSYHDTNEWHPSVDNDGMIVYTRWDYVDRDSDIAHHIWHCFPDGRDPRSFHGNYPDVRESRPWMEMAIRAIPNSRRYVATSTPHHGQNYGSLVMIDVRVPDDRAMSQLKRITPETHLPESEKEPGVPHPLHKGRHTPRSELYGTAWPLSEDFYLCVYGPDQRNYGIYLLDSFGNEECLYFDQSISCLDPIPFKLRPRPPAIPIATTQAEAEQKRVASHDSQGTGKLVILDVYESEFPWPKDTELKELRIINLFPKSNSFASEPYVGTAAQSLARGILGTVPIQPDGSVCCEVPTGVGIYFQVLDAKGQAVQTMRSTTYLHTGETLTCVGCHEPKHRVQPHRKRPMPMALRQAPAKLRREAPGSYPLTFPRLVQPVLDRHCVTCHQESPKAPDLDGKTFRKYGWSSAFANLRRYAWGKAGGNGSIGRNQGSYSVPGQVGAKASRLLRILETGHHDLQLPPEDLRRITLWLDTNSVFYGAYKNTEAQQVGQVIPPKWGYLPEWQR